MRIGQFKYKCRNCGNIYIAGSSNERYSLNIMTKIALGVEAQGTLPFSLVDVHECDPTRWGVADFIGVDFKHMEGNGES